MITPPMIRFGTCPVVVTTNKTEIYYVWRMSEETKDKIRQLLGAPGLHFGFDSTLEYVPTFYCPVCDIEITFFDQVRAAYSGGAHSSERLIELLQKEVLLGNGAVHHITCENGHPQPITMGWAQNFGWSYK